MDTNLLDNIISSNITPISSEVLSFVTQAGAADAGEAINTVVFAALANNKVCDLLGVVLGEKSGTGVASSIVFTTGVMDSTLEMAWNYSGNTFNAQKAAMIAAVGGGTTGAWACHYPSGLLVIKKKTNGTSQTITSYKVRKQDVANITFNAGDLEIGAVELKDPTTDVRATIDANGVAVSANRATMPAATTMQNAAVANADGASLNVQGMALAVISIVSSPVMSGGTLVNFEVSPDDSQWVPVIAHQVGVSGNQGTTTSTDGGYRINTAGFKSLRARISAYSAGTVTVKGYATPTSSHPTTVAGYGQYNATPTVRTEGQGGPIQTNTNGDTKTVNTELAQAFDQELRCIRTPAYSSQSATYSPTEFKNLGANTTLNMIATAAQLLSITATNINAAVRYLMAFKTATVPAGAAVPAIIALPIPPISNGVPGVASWSAADLSERGINSTVGWAFAISTTPNSFTDSATAADHTVQAFLRT